MTEELIIWLVAKLIQTDKALEKTHDPEEVAYLQGVSDGYIETREMIAKLKAKESN